MPRAAGDKEIEGDTMIDLDNQEQRQKITIALLCAFIIMDFILLGVGYDYKVTCQDRCMNLTNQLKEECAMWKSYYGMPSINWTEGNLTWGNR